jgi:hypothetical protein
MNYKKLIIISKYFDFILSYHINQPENQQLLFRKLSVFDLSLFINKYFSNFFLKGGIDLFHSGKLQLEHSATSYALSQVEFLINQKNIDINTFKKFISEYSKYEKSKQNYILKSNDNLYKSITKKNDHHILSKVNGVSILRPFVYIIQHFKDKDCLQKSLQITRLFNDHPYETIGTFLLYKTILKLHQDKNPYKLFKYLLNSLENISKTDYQLIIGDTNPKIFEQFKLEIIANIDEFVRVVYTNHNNIPNEKGGDIFEFSKQYSIFLSQIIANKYPSRDLLFCNNSISVLIIAINVYIQYFYYYNVHSFIPLQNTILHLVSILGYSHHSSILLSYFIFLLHPDTFLELIPSHFKKLISQ